MQELLYKISDIVESIPNAPEVEGVAEKEERKVYRFEKQEENDYTIRRVNDVFVIESPSIEKLIKRTNFSTQDGVARFARILRNMGIDQDLRSRGAVHGQTIQIGDFDFEFDEKS